MKEAVRHTGLLPEDALTSDNAVTACLARIASSTATEELHKLVNAELGRNTSTAVLLTALAIFQVQTHSSVAAQLTSPKGCGACQQLFSQTVESEHMEHARRTHNCIKEEAAL